MYPQDELIAQMQERVALLEQENALLRCQLAQQSCSHPQTHEQTQSSRQSTICTSATEHYLLEATASAATALLRDNFDQAINTALQILGESLDTDRVRVLESLFDDPARPFSRYHKVLHEWIRSDRVPPRSPNQIEQIDTRNLENFFETFVQNKGFGGLRSEWDESLQALFQGVEVKSAYTLPIYVDEQWWGILAFDDCQEAKHHTPAELATLQTAAICIGSAIQRQRMQQAREEAERQALLREKAAQERAAELAKANEALRRGVERLTEVGNIDALLDLFLLEVMAVTGASAGAVFDRVVGTEFQMRSLAQDGVVNRVFDSHAPEPVFKEITTRDPVGVFRQLAEGQVHCHEVDDYFTSWFPEAAAYHRQQGHQVVWNFPFWIGREVAGYVGIAFREKRLPNQVMTETIQVLTHQVSLALETSRLAEKAKQAAVAREQEKAAQERVAELEKANEALARTAVRLTEQGDLTHFFDELLLETSRQLGADSAHLVIYDDKQRRYSSLHQYGGNVAHEPELPASFSLDEMQPENFHTIAERERRPHWYDPQADADLFSPGAGAFLSRVGLRSVLHVPLIVGEQIVGGIGFAFREPYPECSQRQILVEALAHQAALAIQLIQLAEEAQQAAILAERNRMAGEIHDTLAQSFTGILVHIGAANQVLIDDLEATQSHLEMIDELARTGLSEARRSVTALRPQLLEEGSLHSALYRLVTQMRASTDTALVYETKGIAYPLLAEVENNLLRMGQEALTNAVKYACASEIRIELVYGRVQCILRVKDNGQGFGVGSVPHNGFGLLGMSERAERIGAQLRIQSQLGQGTEIVVTIQREQAL
jgi:signal transduction histidine kinase